MRRRFPWRQATNSSACATHDIPKSRTYVDDLLDILRDGGARGVVQYRGVVISCTDFLSALCSHATGLREMGIGRGQLVALAAPNCPEALTVHYAAHMLGAATVFLPALPVLRTARLLEDLSPDLLIVFPSRETGCFAGVFAVRTVSDTEIRRAGSATRQQRGGAQPAVDPESVAPMALPDDLAVVSCSGGTTGIPKGSTRDFRTWTRLVSGPRAPQCRRLIDGPLANLSGVLATQTILAGGSLVLEERFDAARTLEAVEVERITDVFVVEPQLADLIDHPDVATRDLRSLRTVTHVGTTAPAALRERARKRLGPCIVHAYASSETGVVSVCNPSDADERAGAQTSVGQILPGVEVRFRGEDGEISSNAGILEIRSETMLQSYRSTSRHVQVPLERHWFRTSDRGFLDYAGHLHVLGRADDCIDLDTSVVGPVDVEDRVMRHDAIRYAVAFRSDDALIVAVVLWPQAHLAVWECGDAVRRLLGRGREQTTIVVVCAKIPTTPQGKPDRAAILTLADTGFGTQSPTS